MRNSRLVAGHPRAPITALIACDPPAPNRARQRPTALGMMPNSAAMSWFILLSAASSTIFVRCINRTGVPRLRDQRVKSVRYKSVNSIPGADFMVSCSFLRMKPATNS